VDTQKKEVWADIIRCHGQMGVKLVEDPSPELLQHREEKRKGEFLLINSALLLARFFDIPPRKRNRQRFEAALEHLNKACFQYVQAAALANDQEEEEVKQEEERKRLMAEEEKKKTKIIKIIEAVSDVGVKSPVTLGILSITIILALWLLLAYGVI